MKAAWRRNPQLFLARWMIFMFGLIIVAFGIVLMIRAELGSAPWEVFHIGLSIQFGLTVGTWSILVGLFFVVLTCVLTRSWVKVGTVMNMILIGVFIDIFMLVPWLVTPASFWGQMTMLIVGIIILGWGVGIYIAPNCGAGPRDGFVFALTQLTKLKVQWVWGTMEMIVLLAGWWLGGPVFIGTVIYCLSIGPIIGRTIPTCQRWVERLLLLFDRPLGKSKITDVEELHRVSPSG